MAAQVYAPPTRCCTAEASHLNSTAPQKIKVLAIDDDADDIVLLKLHLQSIPGLQVELISALFPDEGIRQLDEQSFDLVFLDYQLGACTGLEVFHRIRERHDTPVILLTDQGDEELAVSSLMAGIADYLPKSAANQRSLRRAMTNALEKAQLQRRVAEKQADLERTVKELRARTEEIQSFYHTLSHELKTPLTAAREFVCIVLDGLQGPLSADQRASLGRTRACCDQMTLLMNDILDATRLETGKMHLRPRLASLGAVIDQAMASCASRASSAGVALRADVEHGMDRAFFDPTRILQVLTNLLDNAIKYSRPGSDVLLRVSRDPEETGAVRVSVEDHGRGIPADRIERIFDRLYQANEDDATIRGGLGIGLYICKEVLRLHGETIAATSVPGAGSTFTFRLRTSCSQLSEGSPQRGGIP